MSRPGNWICMSCTHLNVHLRELCQGCGDSRSCSAAGDLGFESGRPAESVFTTGSDVHPSDWYCNSASGGNAPPQMWLQPPQRWAQPSQPTWKPPRQQLQPPVMWSQPSPPLGWMPLHQLQPPLMWTQPSPYPLWQLQQPQTWLPQLQSWPPATIPSFWPHTEGFLSQPQVERYEGSPLHPRPQDHHGREVFSHPQGGSPGSTVLSPPSSPRTEENERADEEQGSDGRVEAHDEQMRGEAEQLSIINTTALESF